MTLPTLPTKFAFTATFTSPPPAPLDLVRLRHPLTPQWRREALHHRLRTQQRVTRMRITQLDYIPSCAETIVLLAHTVTRNSVTLSYASATRIQCAPRRVCPSHPYRFAPHIVWRQVSRLPSTTLLSVTFYPGVLKSGGAPVWRSSNLEVLKLKGLHPSHSPEIIFSIKSAKIFSSKARRRSRTRSWGRGWGA